MDTITDILARPGEAARQLSEMRAALEASAACVPAARAALEEIKVKFAAVIAERDAALVRIEWLEAELDHYKSADTDWAGAAIRHGAERDAARAEVARRTTIMQSTAQKAERWIHDTDQFSPRTSAEDMVVQDGQLEELARIVKALRGDTAPAQPDAPARLYGKYRISKADGSPTDPEAEYFVLRIDTDPAARDAVAAYADYISFSAPEFCDDLRRWLVRVPLKPAPAGGEARP